MLSKIIVPVRGDGMVETVLGHAAALAKHHNAHIVVAHCRARTEDLMPYSRALPSFARDTMVEQARELADQQEQAVRDQLHELAPSLDLMVTDTPSKGTPSIEFVEEYGMMADVIKRTGRLADLVMVAKPDRDRNLGVNSLKSALFRTGRPVLMCPPKSEAPDGFGRRMTIAWNGSLEASRAVAMTMSIAEAAQSVTILAGGKGEPQGAPAEELVAYYGLRGIAAEIHRFETRTPAESLLSITTELGANLLVMGAYGQNHERETLFGGNTQVVVDKAEIPVILVH